MGREVIGQTGSVVLSDDLVNRTQAQMRTVRYRHVQIRTLSKVTGLYYDGWMCEVIGPFHDKVYGTMCYGTTQERSKAALKAYLSDNLGYHGNLMLSDEDASDTVGIVDRRLLDYNPMSGPICARAMLV